VEIKTKIRGGVLKWLNQLGVKGTPERKRYGAYPGGKDGF
jgi:hypothetical protein